VLVNWNLSPKKLRQYREADVLVLSVGKSGRTWLRVLLNKYLSLHFDVPFGIGELHARNPAIPLVRFDHELWSHYCDARWIDRLLGSNIVPAALLRQKRVVVVYRDPRDVVVSLHFHKTRRSRRRMDVDLSAFIRDPHYGVANIVRVMNLWRQRLEGHPHSRWLRYEDMKADARRELSGLAAFIGLEVKPELVDEAVKFSEFENMKKMEANNEFGGAILQARDVSDPDSFKVREGRVGGYMKHFGAADLRFLDEAVARLDPFFGYRAG
jgi:hypothetical protein